MRYVIPLLATVLALSLPTLFGPARGEVFVLKSGGRVEGEFLNPQREPGSAYQLRTADGLRLALDEGQVHRVIVVSDTLKEYQAALPRVANTVDGHWAMAEWCKDAGLIAERKRHLGQVVRLDPDHKGARSALGYSEYGGKWMTQEEFMTSQGYVRHKGGWSTQQQVELESRERQRELDEKEWRKQIKIWFDQLGTKRSETATAGLLAIREPTAVPALSEILADNDQPRNVRLMCLEILSKLPPGLATATLVKLSMDERDESIRDKCLDELVRSGPEFVLSAYMNELKNEKDTPISRNARINRAALCLQRFGDKDATLPLINALVTEHFVIVDPGAAGGGGPINFNAGGPPGQGGLGGLSMGSKAKKVKGKAKNPHVLGALTSMYPGVNFEYDVEDWKRWYIDTHTTTNVDLRRGE